MKSKQKKSVILLPLILLAVALSSCQKNVTIIYNASQLLSLLNSMEYKTFGATTKNLPITKDILIIGTVTISSEDLEIPEGCINKYYCRQAIGFDDKYGAEGITLTPISDDVYAPPAILTLTNIRLRFRTVLESGLPVDGFSTIPLIYLMPPSDYECQDAQIKCEVDKVCYNHYRSYCQLCLTLSQEECACQNEEGVLPDNEHCEMYEGDAITHGTCQQGICVTQ